MIQGRCGLPHRVLSYYVSLPLHAWVFTSGLWPASPPSASALGTFCLLLTFLSASTLQRLGLGNFCSVPHLWVRLDFSSFLTGMSLKSVSDSVLGRHLHRPALAQPTSTMYLVPIALLPAPFCLFWECDTNQICLLCMSVDTRAYRVSVTLTIIQFLSSLFLPRTIRPWWFRSPPFSGPLPCRQCGKCLSILPILWEGSAGPLGCYCLQTSPPRTVVGLSHGFPGLCTHLLDLCSIFENA